MSHASRPGLFERRHARRDGDGKVKLVMQQGPIFAESRHDFFWVERSVEVEDDTLFPYFRLV